MTHLLLFWFTLVLFVGFNVAEAAPHLTITPEAEHGTLHSLGGTPPGSLVTAGQANAPEPKAIPRPTPKKQTIDPLLVKPKTALV